ncbi:class I SAM-dependent methyltransferase [Chitinophaga eiseniae]|uniref:Class I SAM-dependent methyltransferase n=1 Tax=Chitinophaga eiseniae TaxID=634771 RepID=A0A847SEP6_9BACT|nr:class I SAM-dependent methyltransferase [Chitinophaga eiseniae]NLR78233.1 class I SAM-dependent methyltransferase [Chitinophaga eiseniae]
MQNMWDERYSRQEFVYGREPNEFFKLQLDQLPTGSILMPADGEGRNGVYAATKGWAVTSCDLSQEGRNKALQLAAERGTTLEYLVGDIGALSLPESAFDAIGLIFAHFPPDQKSFLLQRIARCLKPGGYLIFEAYSKQHVKYQQVNPTAGGPKGAENLYSTEELLQCFGHYDIQLLEETEIEQGEGIFHNGRGIVLRFVGRKPVE